MSELDIAFFLLFFVLMPAVAVAWSARRLRNRYPAPQESLGCISSAAIAAGHGMVHRRTDACARFGCEQIPDPAPQEPR